MIKSSTTSREEAINSLVVSNPEDWAVHWSEIAQTWVANPDPSNADAEEGDTLVWDESNPEYYEWVPYWKSELPMDEDDFVYRQR
jgi:hypothetical protein